MHVNRFNIRRAVGMVMSAIMLIGGFMGAAPAFAAEPNPSYPSDANKPQVESLLGEFKQYWSSKDNPSNAPTDVFRGSVTDGGAPILRDNDGLVLAINGKAAGDDAANALVDGKYTQLQRALIDADRNNRETFVDAFGPVVGEWFWDGMVIDPGTNTRALQRTFILLNDMVRYIPVIQAKQHFNYPRPSMNTAFGDAFDRGVNGESDLKGLAPALAIQRAADWTDPYRGCEHDAGYAGLIPNNSQSFPPGHTMAFYASGLTLAAMMSEFAPQIATRASEGGNDRIVVGVHYPLDVIGGRIVGEASAAGRLSDDEFYKARFLPARKELRDYLTTRGHDAGYGDTLEEIIARTKANTTNGYRNSFTDAVSNEPVNDVPSAVKAFTRRMTYNFAQVGHSGQRPRVPDGAEALLRTVFPTLTAQQRTAVLGATEIDSGYPLDSTSEGWQRLNLAAAFSSKVTLDESGAVVGVEPGSQAQVVTRRSPTIDSIRVGAKPATDAYRAGQRFDPAGLVVIAAMSDGSTKTLDAGEYGIEGFDSDAAAGVQQLTVVLRADPTKTATFAVTIEKTATPVTPATPSPSTPDPAPGDAARPAHHAATPPHTAAPDTKKSSAPDAEGYNLAQTGAATSSAVVLIVLLAAGGLLPAVVRRRSTMSR